MTDQELAYLWDRVVVSSEGVRILQAMTDRPMKFTAVVGPDGISSTWIGPAKAVRPEGDSGRRSDH